MREHKWSFLIIVIVLVITLLHYNTHLHHEPLHALYRKLYYLPILLAAFHFGLSGSIVCAVVCVILYVPHLHFDHGADYLMSNADRSLEVVLYVVIALITGGYSSLQKRLIGELRTSHEDLKSRTESLVAAQEALQKHIRLHSLGLLGAGVSHEIRNPLASLKGSLEIAFGDDKACSPQERKELSDIALNEVNRIQEILNRFLSLTKSEASPGQSTDLKELCQDMMELTRAERNKAGLNCSLKLPPSDCIFYGPPGPIQQVLLNLLINAIATAKSKVDIVLQVQDEHFELSVMDDGEGVPQSLETAIFEFFYTTRQDGSGLGLPISSQLMNQMSGSLILKNNSNPTVFTMTFPSAIPYCDGGKHHLALDPKP